MARAPKLKVYRMAVGFHDAYVAAPSQKAAAAAWGSGTDVFARGEAELVTDPALTDEPLARPGEIVKRLRGTAAEQIAALGGRGRAGGRGAQEAAPADPRPDRQVGIGQVRTGQAPAAKAARPSRAALDATEAALAEAEARHAEALRAIEDRQAALDRERARWRRRATRNWSGCRRSRPKPRRLTRRRCGGGGGLAGEEDEMAKGEVKGGCHCGAVTLCVPHAPKWVGSCNCFLCSKLAWLVAYYPDEQVTVEGETVAYVWGDR
jgi:hypothetical protein